MVKKTLKRYVDEVRIVDGVIITILLSVFMIFNWNSFISSPIIYSISMFLFIWVILFFVFMTVKDVFTYIDEIQISIALFLAMLFLFLNQFFLGIVMFWVVCIYCLLFLLVFTRNLILRELSFNKKIKW